MSYTSEAGRFVYQVLNHRAVAEIQRNIVKRGKRNGVTRMFHAKNDKETIATWRLDLNRILHIFNVRSITSVWPLSADHLQTELAINTNVAVSDIRHEVVNTRTIVTDVHRDMLNTHTIVSNVHRDFSTTQTIVSDVHRDVTNTHTVVSNTHVLVSDLQRDVANTQTIVSDMHRTMVESQERTDDKNWPVSFTLLCLSLSQHSPFPRLQLGW